MVRMHRSPAVWALAALTVSLLTGCKPAPPTLSDLSSVDELKARFNGDAGKPRIVLLLSPT
jgi:hypothetical protein